MDDVFFPARFVLVALLLSIAAAAVLPGCSSLRRVEAAVRLGHEPPLIAPADSHVDDWTTFAHDQLRSGYQPQRVGLNVDNVARLAPRWIYHFGAHVKASPLVADGRVYVASTTGTVRALAADSGRPIWSFASDLDIQMTPALADGLLFIGDHRVGGAFVALDAQTGRPVWRAPLPGGVRAEPVVAHGIVFESDAAGDKPVCTHAGVHAFNERNGQLLWSWYVGPGEHPGGGVWAPLSYADGHVIFGTGNTCLPNIETANSIVSLDEQGRRSWSYRAVESDADEDFGGGTMLLHGQAIATSKNGTLYDVDRNTGELNWATPLGSADGYGGIGTPSSDGTTIVASAGFLRDPTRTAGSPGGALVGLDTLGNERWRVTTETPIQGDAPISGGLVFAAIDHAFVVLDARSGARLWTYRIAGAAYPSPAIVPSGLYCVDDGGDVYAFSRR